MKEPAYSSRQHVGTMEFPPLTAELLDKIVRRVLAAGAPVKIVLFGSRDRGDVRPDSDLDLLIIEETDLPPPKRDARYLPLDHLRSQLCASQAALSRSRLAPVTLRVRALMIAGLTL